MGPGPGTLRVSVVGGHDRVDLVVPAAVSVAELLPDLVRRLPGLDPLSGEVRLSVLGGPPLETSAGLAAQGVADGALLTVTAAADDGAAVAVEDDLACLVAETVESVPRPAAGAARRAGLAVAAVLLGLGALGALVLPDPVGAVLSGATAAVLLGAAALAGRRAGSPVPAVAAWLAVTHATVAGLVAGPVGAGAAGAAAGVAAALGVRRGPALWAAPVAGAVLCVVGIVATAAQASLPVAATAVLVLVVLTGDLQPWLAATFAGLVPPPLGEEPPTAPDREAVSGAVRRAHDVLVVTSVATGLLLAVLGPVVAGGGAWGVAVVALCCAVVGLRSRRHRVGPGGVVGLLAGTVPLVPMAVVLWEQQPAWRLALVACIMGVGLLALAAVALPAPRGARAGRGAELVEALALVALPPTALAATGLLDLVRELAG